MRKTEILINNPVHLGQLVLDVSKTVMYEFWNDYANWKYGEKSRLCYMDTGSFIIYEGTDGIYKDFSEDVETIFLLLQTMNLADHCQNEKTKKLSL